jgi:hypothetical protein
VAIPDEAMVTSVATGSAGDAPCKDEQDSVSRVMRRERNGMTLVNVLMRAMKNILASTVIFYFSLQNLMLFMTRGSCELSDSISTYRNFFIQAVFAYSMSA